MESLDRSNFRNAIVNDKLAQSVIDASDKGPTMPCPYCDGGTADLELSPDGKFTYVTCRDCGWKAMT